MGPVFVALPAALLVSRGRLFEVREGVTLP